MAVCRFCGARLEQPEGGFVCPLCGCRNDPESMPVRAAWAGRGFVHLHEGARLPFGSTVDVSPGQQALLCVDGRDDAVLSPGRHVVYPEDPGAARVAFLNADWQPADGALTRTLSLQESIWELRARYDLEARISDPAASLATDPLKPGMDERIRDWLQAAVEAELDAALAGLDVAPGEGRDALSARVDAALAGIDAESASRRLAEAGRGFIALRGLALRRSLLAKEEPDGEPCPVCGRRNPRREGSHAKCAFCDARLYWCPNCRGHVLRRDDRWCPACRGRIYS